jgi:hypothetical protein
MPILRELEQEFPLATPMADMPDVPQDTVSISSSQEGVREYRSLCLQKRQWRAKVGRFFSGIVNNIQRLSWSDPLLGLLHWYCYWYRTKPAPPAWSLTITSFLSPV